MEKRILMLILILTLSEAMAGFNTKDLNEQAPIQANIVTSDLKHVYYVMSGSLYCYSILLDDETANCRNRKADVIDPQALPLDYHGPIRLPGVDKLSSPVSLSWVDGKTLLIQADSFKINFNLPEPTAVTKNLTWGINGHPGLVGNPAYGDFAAQLEILKSRNLTSYRVGFVPVDPIKNPDKILEIRTMVEAAKAKGIELSVIVDLSWLLCSKDAVTFDSNVLKNNYNLAYKTTREFILALSKDKDGNFRPLIKDWELGNEIDLKLGLNARPSNWDTGWDSSEWRGVILGTNKDYFLNWAQGIKGAADAINSINLEKGTAFRKLVNTTGTHFGFLKFLQEEKVDFDVITYHAYLHRNHSPYSLGGLWNSKKKWFNTFSYLASFNLPVHLNEINCGETYDEDYKNIETDPKFKTCVQTLFIHLSHWTKNTQINLEKIFAYELFDEPYLKDAPEQKFGLMKDASTPKPMLHLLTSFAGGTLTPNERISLNAYSSLIPVRTAKTFSVSDNFSMQAGSTQSTAFGNVVFQKDGNFVLYNFLGNVIWATNSYSSTFTDGRAIFQTDGNFVLYKKDSAGFSPVWSTNTYASTPNTQGASTLTFVNRLPLMRLTDAQKNIWWVNRPEFSPGELILKNGQFVKLNLASVPHTFLLQEDGNLVLYKDETGQSVWSTTFANQNCASKCVLNFQEDGNLVLYKAGAAYWSTRTYNKSVNKLIFSATAPFLSIVDSGYTEFFRGSP